MHVRLLDPHRGHQHSPWGSGSNRVELPAKPKAVWGLSLPKGEKGPPVFYGRRSYSYSPGMERGEHGGDSGVRGNVKIEASGEVETARWSFG